jgi:hypothetical protein
MLLHLFTACHLPFTIHFAMHHLSRRSFGEGGCAMLYAQFKEGSFGPGFFAVHESKPERRGKHIIWLGGWGL